MVLVQAWSFFQLSFFQAIYLSKMSFAIFQSKKTPVQAIITRSSKSRKIDLFSKGVILWFWSKNGKFSNFFFNAIQARKISFTIFKSEKMPSQAIKTRRSKSRNIDIFPKRLTHGFCPKMATFSFFFSKQQREGKCLLRYSRAKKRLSRL